MQISRKVTLKGDATFTLEKHECVAAATSIGWVSQEHYRLVQEQNRDLHGKRTEINSLKKELNCYKALIDKIDKITPLKRDNDSDNYLVPIYDWLEILSLRDTIRNEKILTYAEADEARSKGKWIMPTQEIFSGIYETKVGETYVGIAKDDPIRVFTSKVPSFKEFDSFEVVTLPPKHQEVFKGWLATNPNVPVGSIHIGDFCVYAGTRHKVVAHTETRTALENMFGDIVGVISSSIVRKSK